MVICIFLFIFDWQKVILSCPGLNTGWDKYTSILSEI